jgi:hypothetical protein
MHKCPLHVVLPLGIWGFVFFIIFSFFSSDWTISVDLSSNNSNLWALPEISFFCFWEWGLAMFPRLVSDLWTQEIFLPQLPKYLDYRHGPPHLALVNCLFPLLYFSTLELLLSSLLYFLPLHWHSLFGETSSSYLALVLLSDVFQGTTRLRKTNNCNSL